MSINDLIVDLFDPLHMPDPFDAPMKHEWRRMLGIPEPRVLKMVVLMPDYIAGRNGGVEGLFRRVDAA